MKHTRWIVLGLCLTAASGCVRAPTPAPTPLPTQQSPAVIATPEPRADDAGVVRETVDVVSSVAESPDATVESVAIADAGAPSTTPAVEPRQVNVVNGRLVFNAATCAPARGVMPWAMGSVSVNVLGKRDGQCVFESRSEIEGGFSVSLCRMAARGTIRVEQTARRPRVSWDPNTCQETGSGNELMP